MKKVLLAGLILCFFSACQKRDKIEDTERAFYYWKSDQSGLDAKEQSLLDTLKIKKLYIKFFEVKYDATMGNIPFAKTGFDGYYYRNPDKPKPTLNLIPTVFIKNDVFLKSSRSELDTLANNVSHLVSKFYGEKFNEYKKYTEIQIDCDWTLKSKDSYFYFLKKMTQVSGKKLSCTLRLYPYKYRTKMGIPPVSSATLMCYNLIQPFSENSKNSILDIKELESYLTTDEKYPIHLDVALPVFSWAHHYQYDAFKEFVKLDKDFLKKACDKKSELWYEVKKDTSIGNSYFRVGDKIKYEDVSQYKVNEAIKALKSKVKFDKKITVTFFHLDSSLVKKYNYETLNRFYTSFSN
ncbi:MAG: hypothetical protein QM710_00180 [Flavobacterium sp.]